MLFAKKKGKAKLNRYCKNYSTEPKVIRVVHDMKMQALADELRRNVMLSKQMGKSTVSINVCNDIKCT